MYMQPYHNSNFQEPLRGYPEEELRHRSKSAKTQKPSVHYSLEAFCAFAWTWLFAHLCVFSHYDDDGSYLLSIRLYLQSRLLREEEHLGWEEHSAIFYKTEGQRTKPNVPSSNIPVNSLCLWYASCQQQQQQHQHHQLLLFVYSC